MKYETWDAIYKFCKDNYDEFDIIDNKKGRFDFYAIRTNDLGQKFKRREFTVLFYSDNTIHINAYDYALTRNMSHLGNEIQIIHNGNFMELEDPIDQAEIDISNPKFFDILDVFLKKNMAAQK